MAADVSSLVRVLNGYTKEDQHRTVGNDSNSEKSTALITRDLLGDGSNSFSSSTSKLVVDSQELDLDLQVPNGWEKRLDLKVCPFSHLGLFVFLEKLTFSWRKLSSLLILSIFIFDFFFSLEICFYGSVFCFFFFLRGLCLNMCFFFFFFFFVLFMNGGYINSCVV